MKKSFILLGTLFVSGLAFAQVGADTGTPQTTLDVVEKPTDISSPEGVIAPRFAEAQLRAKAYPSSQEGALVYVKAADLDPAEQTINAANIDYYYSGGTLGQTIKSSALSIFTMPIVTQFTVNSVFLKEPRITLQDKILIVV